MAFNPYTQRFAQNQLEQFNRLAAGRPATPTMDRTQMRLPNMAALPPAMRKPTVSPLLQRVAAQARQRTALMPSLGDQAPSPTPQQTQEADTGLMGALRAPLMSPRGQAISQAALAGLEAGGYSTTPTTLGQALGRMGQAALQGYGAGEDRLAAEAQRQAAAEKAAFDRRMSLAQFAQKEREIAGTSGAKSFGNEKQLRSEFDKQAKNFDEARLGFEKVQKAAMTDTPTGPTDLALIFGYMKVIDPTSVVREGEFATAEQAGGVSEQLRNLYNKVRTGQRLTEDVREQFVQAARTQFQPYMEMQRNIENRYTNLSKAYDLDPTKVVLSRIPEVGTLANPYTAFATEADAADANLPKGTYVMIGGELYVEE